MNSDIQPIDTVYLTGWEYNRLLDPDPVTSSRASSLPANVLWNNGSLFWLFRHVQCPKRAYEGDVSAADRLKWTSGKVFEDLKEEIQVLKLFDLNEDLSKQEQDDLRESSSQLRPICDKNRLHRAIVEGDDSTIDRIKLALYGPILAKRGWKAVLGLKSVSHWANKSQPLVGREFAMLELTTLFDRGAASPLLPSPNELVTSEVLRAQHEEEQRAQRHLIPSLLLGDLQQDEYERELQKGDMSKYSPLNAEMAAAWTKGKETLKRLRGTAERLLWPRLHNDWLPEIQINPDKRHEIASEIEIAIRRVEEKAKVASNDNRDPGFTASVIAVTVAVFSIMKSLGCDSDVSGLTSGVIPLALEAGKPTLQKHIGEFKLSDSTRADVRTLEGFFQNARMSSQPTTAPRT